MFRYDVLIDELAAQQQGVVARWQLLERGVSASGIDRRISAGRLRTVHRGVYAVGPVLGALGVEMAAILACGHARAAVSHTSAAVCLQLLAGRGPVMPVHVLVQGRNRPVRRGIRPHRVRVLDSRETTECDGVPVTSVARTLLDVAALLPRREVERVLATADRQGVLRESELVKLLKRHGGHRGAGVLRSLLHGGRRAALTRSEAELRVLELLRRSRLPEPLLNVRLHGFEVDFYWAAQRVVMEIDGYAFHASRTAFQRDRSRDRSLTAAGLTVLRFTWEDIIARQEAMIVEVTRALYRSAA
jgi:very-short-patch-repair endonuclease